MPVQVWATWFPAGEKPVRFIQGFPVDQLTLSSRGAESFRFSVGGNGIEESSCHGDLHVEGHRISWNLEYRSTFANTLSNKGWIGFSRTPHSDAIFSGQIVLDGRKFEGAPLGCGLQGHNCGYRHRSKWTWGHAYFAGNRPSTLEALVYDLPFGLTFRRAILWHRGKRYIFRVTQQKEDRDGLEWSFCGVARDGSELETHFDGTGIGCHRVPYLKTDCSGILEVANHSMANASLTFLSRDGMERRETTGGAVLEMGGS